MTREKANAREPKSQHIWFYTQNRTALGKIKALEQDSSGEIQLKIISIDDPLPLVIDDTDPYLPEPLGADLVLDHLQHPDLSHALAERCEHLGIPVVASGKKPPMESALIPRTCCALTQQEGLGYYGQHYGQPVYRVTVEKDRIAAVETLRGAPCGATWDAARKIVGLSVEEAKTRVGLETQFFCVANPASWDPITGKSPVHIAADLHKAALITALKKDGDNSAD